MQPVSGEKATLSVSTSHIMPLSQGGNTMRWCKQHHIGIMSIDWQNDQSNFEVANAP